MTNTSPKLRFIELVQMVYVDSQDLELQIMVSKILSRGFVFSIMWMGGIGSLIALLSGLKARKMIRESNGEIHGMKLAWWCIISGGLGIVGLPLAIISVITSHLK